MRERACFQQSPPSPAAGGNEETREKKEADCSGAREDEGSGWPGRRVCHTHERAIPIQQTVEALDMTEEGKTADQKSNAAFSAGQMRVEIREFWLRFRCGDAALLLGAAPPAVRGAPPPNAVGL